MIYDDIIMRTIVDLPEDQVSALAELCAREGISRAEAVRRAVEKLLSAQPNSNRQDAFGAWAHRGERRTLVDTLRGEWER